MESQHPSPQILAGKTVLITGAAQRIGAHIARRLHGAGANIALHYRSSRDCARRLASELEDQRSDSVELIKADLLNTPSLRRVVESATGRWNSLDVLVNNASAFYPTPLGSIQESGWDELIGSNLKAPLFLSQAAAPHLRKARGCIVNMTDIHGLRALDKHVVYCVAKAGLVMLTKSLARELAPDIRVNALAPGAILPPSGHPEIPAQVTDDIPLQRTGTLDDIAGAVLYLVQPESYITGQVIAIDGGLSL